MNELDEELENYLIEQSAKILNCEPTEIEWEDDIDEYGFDSIHVTKLCAQINQYFSIDINPAVFLEVSSLQMLGEYLKKNYFTSVEDALL